MSQVVETTPISKHMRGKQSMYKCVDCESRVQGSLGNENVPSIAVPYLFHKMGRGTICPMCKSSNVVKISISMVLNKRWNVAVKEVLASIKGIHGTSHLSSSLYIVAKNG